MEQFQTRLLVLIRVQYKLSGCRKPKNGHLSFETCSNMSFDFLTSAFETKVDNHFDIRGRRAKGIATPSGTLRGYQAHFIPFFMSKMTGDIGTGVLNSEKSTTPTKTTIAGTLEPFKQLMVWMCLAA